MRAVHNGNGGGRFEGGGRSKRQCRGNVRELEHALEQAVVLACGGEIGLDDLPAPVRGTAAAAAPAAASTAVSFKQAKQQVIERSERQFIE